MKVLDQDLQTRPDAAYSRRMISAATHFTRVLWTVYGPSKQAQAYYKENNSKWNNRMLMRHVIRDSPYIL
jgi:hypothetical protein